MTEPESMAQVREEATGGKGGKGKAIIKRSKAETPSRQQDAQPAPADTRRAETRSPETLGTEARRDPKMIAIIEQRAYGLFEAGGRQHGHDLEHWLEAERQITGSADRCER